MEIVSLVWLLAGGAVLVLLAWPAMALTANANRNRFVDQEIRVWPVAAGARIFRDALVGVNPAGQLKPFVPGDLLVGVAYEECDNSTGAAAASICRVRTTGDWEWPLTGVADAHVGRPVFAVDDAALALTGHPDAYAGRVLAKLGTNVALVRFKAPGESPPNGVGSVELTLTGQENFTATGTTGTTVPIPGIGGGVEAKSALGLGVTMVDGPGGGMAGTFDAVAEVALASIRQKHDTFPVAGGITFECDFVLADKGDAAALDVDLGMGTELTANSEASVDHGDMVNLFAFHLDGNSDNILLQSDNDVTDVAPVDTTIDNDSANDVPKRFKGIIRPDGTCEGWIDGVRVLPSTAFAVAAATRLAFFCNMEKTSDDTTAQFILKNLRVCGAAA